MSLATCPTARKKMDPTTQLMKLSPGSANLVYTVASNRLTVSFVPTAMAVLNVQVCCCCIFDYVFLDVGGQWVHIICALFTRGVTFGDIDHLSAISWQEMDHRCFGKKVGGF